MFNSILVFFSEKHVPSQVLKDFSIENLSNQIKSNQTITFLLQNEHLKRYILFLHWSLFC